MKRLEYLRRKLENDDQFFKEYNDFMKELMENCPVGKGPDSKTWYVPHQGVLNHKI